MQTAANLGSNAQAEIVDSLQQAVADTTVATMLAQNFHWNVTGPNFGPLHQMFQDIYEDHFTAQDDLAERIRALHAPVSATLAEMLKRTKVSEASNVSKDTDMIRAMMDAQVTLADTLGRAGAIAAQHDDTLTEDLCIARGQQHEKFAWFLRAHLQ